MQFRTEIRAAVPRARCQYCGVKAITVPWSGKHYRFTRLFEAVAIKVLPASSCVQKAAELLGLCWDCVQAIMQRAVERGMAHRTCEQVEQFGVDGSVRQVAHIVFSVTGFGYFQDIGAMAPIS